MTTHTPAHTTTHTLPTGTYLVLRRTAATGAPLWQRVACALIRWRLVSAYCHGGILQVTPSGKLHLWHATGTRGLHCVDDDFDPTKWHAYPLPQATAQAVPSRFAANAGAGYDWLSLLAFVLPWRVSNHRRLYCFEWCALAMGLPVAGRITPELLLAAYAMKGAHDATTN